MENGWSSNDRGQNGTFQPIWDLWDSSHSRLVWNCTTTTTHEILEQTPFTVAAAAAPAHLLIPQNTLHHHRSSSSLYQPPPLPSRHHWQYPDPHLMCLNLGKRHYFEDPDRHVPVGDFSAAAKRGKGGGGMSVPRCQVEGCHVALANAKGYHKRHKVCEMHSKAPKVTVLGEEQRFCQQCSRFHGVAEFDETKRSCRRRLAGHNERRRKGSHDSISRNCTQGGALSLLSSSRPDNSWSLTSVDLSSRGSAALRDLIAENRATASSIIYQHNNNNVNYHNNSIIDGELTAQEESHSCTNCTIKFSPIHQIYDQVEPTTGSHLTLDLMQASGSAFGFYLS